MKHLPFATLVTFLTLLSTQPSAFAEISLGSLGKVDWGGEIETSVNSYEAEPSGQSTAQEGVIRAHLNPTLDLNKMCSFKGSLLFRADAGNSTRNIVRPDEAYVIIKASPSLRFHAGQMIYNWGNDAVFNPADFLNPRDYYDLFHVDKLGTVALDANLIASNSLSFDFGVIPIFQPSIVSNPTSRWINYSNFASAPLAAIPGVNGPLPFDLQQRNPRLPQLFARASLKTFYFDAALAYSYRYNPFPQVVLFSSNVSFDAINGTPQGQLQGVPYYQQEHFLAFDTSIPVLGAVLFANATVNIPASAQSDIPSDSTILSNYNNAGVASNVSSGDIDNARSTSTAIVTLGVRRDWSHFHAYFQFAKFWYLQGTTPTSLLGQATQGIGVNPADFYNFYSGTLIPGLQFDFGRRLSLRLGSILNVVAPGMVVDATMNYRITDGFKVAFGADYIYGKSGSLLDYYSGNSCATLALDMVF